MVQPPARRGSLFGSDEKRVAIVTVTVKSGVIVIVLLIGIASASVYGNLY